MEQKQKPLQALNLLDRFLFAQAAEDPDTMRDILETIFRQRSRILVTVLRIFAVNDTRRALSARLPEVFSNVGQKDKQSRGR